jgi:hypothetical protein
MERSKGWRDLSIMGRKWYIGVVWVRISLAPHTLTRTRNIMYTEKAFDFIFYSNSDKKIKRRKEKRMNNE